jgi:PAS domain S-box-containing protein
MQALIDYFGTKDLIPHGYCLSWSPVLLWLQVIPDLLITLAYYSIPLMLVYFIRQRKDLPYPWLVALFAGFIVVCGTTHLLSAITIWIPLYWLDGLLKAFTAIISIVTAVLMVWVIPRSLSLPSAAQLQAEIQQRKIAENALRESEAKLATILDSVEAFIYIKDCNYLYQYANQPVRELFGKALENIVGKVDDVFFDEDTTATLHENDRRVIEQGERIESEHTHTFKNNTATRIYLTVKQPLRNKDGSIYGLCGISTDITERKAMENELKASEAKFRSIIEVSPVPMVLLNDEQSNLTYLNPAFVQTFGYNLDDIPTLADWRMKAYPDLEYRRWVEIIGQTTLEKAKQEQTDLPPLELTIRCKNNSIKTVLVTVAMIHDDFADMHLVIMYDITERKQIEAKLNAIFNASVEGIITIDMADIIVSANAAVETIFGYKPEELMGCSINKLMPLSPKELNDSRLPQAEKCAGQIQEIEGLHKNGSVVPLDLSLAKYSIDHENYFTYIVRDVSLRKRREQQDKEHLDQLAHVTRLGLMGEMASGIAHEVNQPLCAISNYTQVSLNLINSENPDLVKLNEILRKNKQQALRAGQIIHRMREFVKPQSKHRSTADINTLIHDAVDLCNVKLKHNDIKLTYNLENNLPPVFVDHIQIEQVIINLIRNSIDALQSLPAKQHRHLSIRSRLNLNKDIQVGVKDNGPGLDEEQQQKIFTPFYTTKADGMGMGLSISRSLIEAHEGTLHFNSQPGKGSSFYFTLPRQEPILATVILPANTKISKEIKR